MTQDRTYFRMLSDTALAEAARYCDNDLAIVLGERLSEMLDVEDQLKASQVLIEDLQDDIAALKDAIDRQQAEIDQLESAIDSLEDDA